MQGAHSINVMQTATITAQDLEGQIRHWLSTPVGSYLGSSYGSPLRDKLQRPMSESMDDVIAKLKHDVPMLTMLGAGAVNILEYEGDSIDKTHLIIEVAGRAIEVNGG